MRFVADDFYVAFDVFPVTAQRLADVDDHVDFHRAVAAGEFRLVTLGLGATVSVRKSDDRANEHAGTAQQFRRALHGVGFDANGRHAVFRGQLATVLQLLIGHCGVQERVVDHFGKFFVRIFHGFECMPDSQGIQSVLARAVIRQFQ